MDNQIPVSAFSSPDVWPSNNCSDGFYGVPLMPNTTNSRICGMQTTNRTLAAACCGGELQQYQCWLYCKYDQMSTTFQACYKKETGSNTTAPGQLFCQSAVSGNTTESLTSSAARAYSTPRLSWLVMVALIALFFVDPASATIIPSLDDGKTLALARRQNANTGCTFEPQQNYTKGGRQIKVSATAGNTPSFGQQIDSGIDNNNRTIIHYANGAIDKEYPAAEPEYDIFFEMMTNTTGRLFPAQSSVSLFYEALVTSGPFYYMTWIPTQLCFNGTISNCGDLLNGTSSAGYEVCGPTFVGDVHSLNETNAIPQGQVWMVITG